MKFGSLVIALASLAHVLAWAAWLWIAFWSHSYRGVSSTPVQVDELGNVIGTAESEVVRHSASFLEVNGLGALLFVFIPVVLTGLALIPLLTWKGKRLGRALSLVGLAIILLAFCVLGYLSFGILYLPAALTLIVATAIFVFRPATREN